MSTSQSLIDNLRELLAAANPGLATKEDLARLEQRVDELAELVEALASRLAAAGREVGPGSPGGGAGPGPGQR